MDAVAETRQFLERTRGRLVIAVVLIVGLYFLVAFGEQAWRMRRLEAEVAGRRAALAAMQERHDALERQLAYLASDQYPSYVERIARRDLNLSHPGETVILVRWDLMPEPEETLAPTPIEQPTTQANWERWLDVFGLRR